MIAIRTAVVTMSPMLRDIIKDLPSDDEGIEIVAEFTTRDQLEDQLKAILPDIVLIGLARGETDRVARSVLAVVPGARVIAFSGSGRHIYIHEMRPHRTALCDVSAKTVVRALYSRHRKKGV